MPNDKPPPEPETVDQQETGGGCQQEPCSDSEYRQPVGIQDAIDWGVFAAKFTARHGSIPRRDDPHHSEYFHWFTVGAHEEFMGRLNP